MIYTIAWVTAYPDLWGYCAVENTVKTSVLTGHSIWNGDEYKTTFIDDSQATTRYTKPGERVCIRQEARFLP